ncbi:MAG: hypothetical protein Terrestrivirus1_216 [Terrestrivirus sp.]|uniref:MSV199 domain-containing protein n=1 Tax=Terrestrivirus sp. TaxID=2487775 RepID=A0A3G4ZKH6_9VIRU|nr:MAG: hypothetical protein Terrestrivirus1_216 [Terrestrivirus sp.]
MLYGEDLLQFLNKYSDVDIDFIREFIRIQEHDQVHYPYNIDLELVAKWLNTKKGKLKETLKTNYTKNVDYVVNPLFSVNGKQKEGSGGHNKETVLLSPDTFKMLCMRSHTKKADKIRYYYVTLEKLMYIFKDEIIESQNKRIKQLEINLKKPKFPIRGAIYVISLDDNEGKNMFNEIISEGKGYKIGKSKDLNKRFKQYVTAHKDDPVIKFIFYSNDIDQLEYCIKNLLRYDQYRDRKEFYITELDQIIKAAKICDNSITSFKCNDCKIIWDNDDNALKIDKLSRHINNHNKNEKVAFFAIEQIDNIMNVKPQNDILTDNTDSDNDNYLIV